MSGEAMPEGYMLQENACRYWHVFKMEDKKWRALRMRTGKPRVFGTSVFAIRYAHEHAKDGLHSSQSLPDWRWM